MKIGTKGLELIKLEEGFESKAYLDSVGLRTIGYGHKITAVDSFPVNGITMAQAEQILLSDCVHVEWFLNKYLEEIHATLNQNQFDALCDFAFNLGVGSLHTLLAHGIAQIPIQIVLWDHAGGYVLEGLKNRRLKELALWQTPDASSAKAVV